MTMHQQQQFDRAVDYGKQAAAFSIYGFHALAAHLWVLAAQEAVTRSGQRMCLANAQDEMLQMRGGTVH